MDLLHSRCAGLDVHKESVVACVRFMEDKEVTCRLGKRVLCSQRKCCEGILRIRR